MEQTSTHRQSARASAPGRANTLASFQVVPSGGPLAAEIQGVDFSLPVPEDVKAVALPTLAHRLALDTKAKYSGVQKEDVVRELLDTVPVGD